MLVSTKGRYALRVMVVLAEHQAAGVTLDQLVAPNHGYDYVI